MVGFLLTKSPTGLANNIMISTDITTAMIIITNASFGLLEIPLVIPIAVSIESKEKTILMTVI